MCRYVRGSRADMKWMLQILRQSFPIGQRRDDAVGETFSPIGVTRPALDLLHDRHEIDETPYRIHVFVDPLLANTLLEVEPSNVFRRHGTVPFSGLSVKLHKRRMRAQLRTVMTHT